MDNLCHTLLGAALGEAGLKSRTRFGNATLMIAANLPDVDVLAFATTIPPVSFRRGWTHGVLAQALLPIALTLVIVALSRVWGGRRGSGPAARAASLLALSYIGVLSHVGLDWLNNYGVRLLTPFTWRWFYGDSVFIIDPWLWLVLGIGVLRARRFSPRAAQTALFVATIYIGAMVGSAFAARARVLDQWEVERGARPHKLMVGPVPVDPFTKTVIADAGDRYITGGFSWSSRRVHWDPQEVLKNDDHPAIPHAKENDRMRAVLTWARFPYYELRRGEGGTWVTLRDLRFRARVGSTTVFVPESRAFRDGSVTRSHVPAG
jgi:inner membrane protein